MLACGNFSDTSSLKLLETKGSIMYQPMQFKNVVVHPGGMQSFIGCIAKLMKSSGLEVNVAAAYAGLTGTVRITSPS